MSHIELLGVPGSGKSAIHDGIDLNHIYKPNRKEVIGLPPLTKLPIFQSGFKKISQLYWQTRLQEHYVANHISRYSSTVELIQYVIEHTDDNVPSLIKILFTTIASYEYGYEKSSNNEIVCLDEGFAQRCLGVFYRGASNGFSIAEFADFIPVPKFLILVEAPPDICQARQQSRNFIKTKSADEIEMLTENSVEIADELEERGTHIINVQNDKELSKSISEIERVLMDMT